ncbi:Sua5 family C-terminal domain-containing protein [Amycolatopsis sp. NEAU-NG30]|uniref:Sua5 family C-terminal domain-containing protein n=1 Tax=Amycolatopsis melonis TaxID=3156488 RepID=A0ABV0LSW1_9PSEU
MVGHVRICRPAGCYAGPRMPDRSEICEDEGGYQRHRQGGWCPSCGGIGRCPGRNGVRAGRLIVHLAAAGQWGGWVAGVPETALVPAKHFWPGPLTLVLRRGRRVPPSSARPARSPAFCGPGGVTPEELEAVLGHPVATGSASSRIRVPGQHPSHYAPRARVVLVEPGEIATAACAGAGTPGRCLSAVLLRRRCGEGARRGGDPGVHGRLRAWAVRVPGETRLDTAESTLRLSRKHNERFSLPGFTSRRSNF